MNQPLLDSTGVKQTQVEKFGEPTTDGKNGETNTTEPKSGEPTTDTKYQNIRVRCIFVLILTYSASLKTLVLPVCSTYARPFCVGCPRGRHFLKGAAPPSKNENVPV